MNVTISRDFKYESAHFLPKVTDGHKCKNLHGHSYKLTVTLRGPVGSDGFVMDFADLKSLVNPIVNCLDHHLLNDIPGLENPTVEVQLLWLWEQFSSVPHLYELVLKETETSSASYRGE
jgi:6-pyruvoyltetrahydropterin/6-carboxytetrahydropterin synthase